MEEMETLRTKSCAEFKPEEVNSPLSLKYRSTKNKHKKVLKKVGRFTEGIWCFFVVWGLLRIWTYEGKT